MFHRLTARIMLACYGVIALYGQGLHLWTGEAACCEKVCCEEGACEAGKTKPATTGAGCSHASHQCGHSHKHIAKPQAAAESGIQTSVAAKQHRSSAHSLRLKSSRCGHDCESCAVCQHQSLGQIFTLSPPAVTGPVESDFLSTPRAESALCPALFSPAQPRAPPAVV